MRSPLPFAALTGAMLASAVAAQSEEDRWKAPPPAWEGTWAGTIGTLPVHLCLNNTPYMNRGAYYYDAHKALIRLELDDEKQDWVEGELDNKAGPRLKIAGERDALSGTWTDGKRSLPVQLRRIGGPSQEFEGPCSSMEFQRPRVSAVRLTSKAGSMDGAKFTTWSFRPGKPFDDIEISTFTLDRTDSGVTKVNGLLRETLPRPDGTGVWLDCMASNANAHGTDGSYSESIEPTLITQRWLAVAHSGESYCGGAHPENYNRPRTFDLLAGAEVDPLDWFKPSAVKVETFETSDEPAKTLTKPFRASILQGWKPEDPECGAAIREEEFWNIGIGRAGLVFSPSLPRVIMACGEDFTIPFARLTPWLNAKGQAAVASIDAEASGKR